MKILFVFALCVSLLCCKEKQVEPSILPSGVSLNGTLWVRKGDIVPIVNMQAYHYLDFKEEQVESFTYYDAGTTKHNPRKGFYKVDGSTVYITIFDEVSIGEVTEKHLAIKKDGLVVATYDLVEK